MSGIINELDASSTVYNVRLIDDGCPSLIEK